MDFWGGSIDIISQIGKGTVVTVKLPRSLPANWFVEKIIVKNVMRFVIVDDDPSIHHVWKNRIISMYHNLEAAKIFNIFSPADFINYMENEELQSQSVLYLIDLVTSCFDDPLIRTRCELLGVKLIPKNMSGVIPIELQA